MKKNYGLPASVNDSNKTLTDRILNILSVIGYNLKLHCNISHILMNVRYSIEYMDCNMHLSCHIYTSTVVRDVY